MIFLRNFKSKTFNTYKFISVFLVIVVAFLIVGIVRAVTPNPGHPWTEVGDGLFAITGPTVARTYTFPDANATVLTTNALVSVAQGGTGAATLTGLVKGNGTSAFTAAVSGTDYVVPSVTTLSSLVSVGTLTTGTWNASLIGLAFGGTNANLTASNGGIVYSTASAFAILGGTATAGQILRSGASAAPTWSTATYPATAGTSGNVLASDGTNWVSTAPDDQVMYSPIGLYAATLTAVTALTTGTTYFEYVGVAGKAYTTCTVLTNVTTLAATITWAEVAVFKGAPVLNGNASLTRLGFTNVATTYNSTGRKSTAVTVTAAAGDNLWVAYGSTATTPFQIRGLLADDIQSGVFQTATVRPSTASSPQATTLGGATAIPGWVSMKCQ
jgi:hypothetical protein